jgi:dipeptidase E
VTKNKKVALITNAMDFTNNYFEWTKSVQRDRRDIEALGLEVEQMDLKDFFGEGKSGKERTEKLSKKMAEFGAVYVRGGNVFILRRAFKQSGFDKILPELAKRKDFVYASFSAGSCVLSPDLNGLQHVDDPELDPEGYKEGERIYEGLGLIDYSIAPHFRSDHRESQKINVVVDYYLNNMVKFVAMTDNDVIISETKGTINTGVVK